MPQARGITQWSLSVTRNLCWSDSPGSSDAAGVCPGVWKPLSTSPKPKGPSSVSVSVLSGAKPGPLTLRGVSFDLWGGWAPTGPRSLLKSDQVTPQIIINFHDLCFTAFGILAVQSLVLN